MNIKYDWVVESLTCFPQEDGKTDVVFLVGWRCSATDGTYSSSLPGSVNVIFTPGQPFTPYADLTQDQVLNWIWDGRINKTDIEAVLAQNINDQINPPVVTPPLPWSA